MWTTIVITTTLVSFFYVFMEWVFIVSKPSFMSLVPIHEKLATLFFVAALLSALCALIIIPLMAIGSLLPRKGKMWVQYFVTLIPAGLLAASALLLIDNFTYTVFKFGIVTSQGLVRIVYAGLFLFLIFIFWREINKFNQLLERKIRSGSSKKRGIITSLVLVVLITPVLFLLLFAFGADQNGLNISAKSSLNRPNIFLITADGVNANRTSVYGYERDTTPYLKEISQTALVAENNFSNSANTAGSIISILTGKYPTTTRVLYPPDILRSQDSYQHLPGILKAAGYYTAQFSLRDYVDAYQLNLLNGFDEVNGRSDRQNPVLQQITQFLPTNYAYFAYELGNRLADRVRHIFFVKDMSNTYRQVTVDPKDFGDWEKIESSLNLLGHLDQPVFVDIHWMGTHGAKFYPQEQVFSASKDMNAQEDWDEDLYDDSLLEFDHAIAKLMDELKKRNLDQNTILIIGSDHGIQYTTIDRIPLIIHFPNGKNAGEISEDTQNLDIAPTILDYLKLNIPSWMEGQSLLAKRSPSPILGVGVSRAPKVEGGVFVRDEFDTKPPFYQFDYITAVDCQKWYKFNLETFELDTGEVKDYTSRCSDSELLPLDKIHEIIIDRLTQDGFQVPEDFARSTTQIVK